MDVPVVVQRLVAMPHTMLGGSAVAVHRQGYQNTCLDAEADPSGWPRTEQVQFLHEVVEKPVTRVKKTKAKQKHSAPATLFNVSVTEHRF